MALLTRIKEIVFEGYSENITKEKFVLKEDSKDAKCTEAKFIRTKPIIVYKFDKVPKKHPSDKTPFLKDIPKVKSICDFIIFYKKHDLTLYVVLCNLKSGYKSNNMDQLKAGEIFSEFIVNTAKRCFYDETCHIDIQYKYVFFSSKLLYKGTSKPGKQKYSKIRNYLSNENTCEECNLDAL